MAGMFWVLIIQQPHRSMPFSPFNGRRGLRPGGVRSGTKVTRRVEQPRAHRPLDEVDAGLQVEAEVDEGPGDALALVLLLLQDEHGVVEELLQLLVGVVDAELLEGVQLWGGETHERGVQGPGGGGNLGGTGTHREGGRDPGGGDRDPERGGTGPA